eukprot:scaffold2300_cov160-Amphora_coffeaeformis.AAC.11
MQIGGRVIMWKVLAGLKTLEASSDYRRTNGRTTAALFLANATIISFLLPSCADEGWVRERPLPL